MAASSTDLERVVCDFESFLSYTMLKSKQVEAIIAFVQGKDTLLLYQLVTENY